MRNRKLALGAIVLVIAALAAVLALGTSPGSAKSSDVFKAAWIYVGPHNDGGWSQAHEDGRLYAQKALGSKVQTTYKENIAVGAQFSQTVASLAAQGYKMIFATSYGYITPQQAQALRKLGLQPADRGLRIQGNQVGQGVSAGGSNVGGF